MFCFCFLLSVVMSQRSVDDIINTKTEESDEQLIVFDSESSN